MTEGDELQPNYMYVFIIIRRVVKILLIDVAKSLCCFHKVQTDIKEGVLKQVIQST